MIHIKCDDITSQCDSWPLEIYDTYLLQCDTGLISVIRHDTEHGHRLIQVLTRW